MLGLGDGSGVGNWVTSGKFISLGLDCLICKIGAGALWSKVSQEQDSMVLSSKYVCALIFWLRLQRRRINKSVAQEKKISSAVLPSIHTNSLKQFSKPNLSQLSFNGGGVSIWNNPHLAEKTVVGDRLYSQGANNATTQWLPVFIIHQNPLKGLLKHRYLGRSFRILTQ